MHHALPGLIIECKPSTRGCRHAVIQIHDVGEAATARTETDAAEHRRLQPPGGNIDDVQICSQPTVAATRSKAATNYGVHFYIASWFQAWGRRQIGAPGSGRPQPG